MNVWVVYGLDYGIFVISLIYCVWNVWVFREINWCFGKLIDCWLVLIGCVKILFDIVVSVDIRVLF